MIIYLRQSLYVQAVSHHSLFSNLDSSSMYRLCHHSLFSILDSSSMYRLCHHSLFSILDSSSMYRLCHHSLFAIPSVGSILCTLSVFPLCLLLRNTTAQIKCSRSF